MEWLFYIGISISFFSFLFIIYLAIQKIIHQDEVQLGWTSIVAINVLILGIISTFLGLIGIYIFKIFNKFILSNLLLLCINIFIDYYYILNCLF